LRLSFTITTFP